MGLKSVEDQQTADKKEKVATQSYQAGGRVFVCGLIWSQRFLLPSLQRLKF